MLMERDADEGDADGNGMLMERMLMERDAVGCGMLMEAGHRGMLMAPGTSTEGETGPTCSVPGHGPVGTLCRGARGVEKEVRGSLSPLPGLVRAVPLGRGSPREGRHSALPVCSCVHRHEF